MSLVALVVLAGCGGGSGPAGPGSGGGSIGLRFVDGPADHVAGGPMPPFRVWVLDVHGKRDGTQNGSLIVDLLDSDGSVRTAGLATVPVSFGQGLVTPSVSLEVGAGYAVRGRFGGLTGESPPFSVVERPDVVRLTSAPVGDVGLLVDGTNNIGPLQDYPYRTLTGEVTVGVLNGRGLSQGVAVFAPDRRPEMVPVTWTAGLDTLTVSLGDPIAIPITVWVIGGSGFATEVAKVQAGLSGLNDQWRRERAGILVGEIEFVDATDLVDGFGVFALGIGAPFGPIAAGVGRRAGRYNIYVVTDVRQDGASVDAFAELPGTAFAVTAVALASGAPRLLGHEFGHNFALQDTPNVDGFQFDPNMMTVGQGSLSLTEGQTFRMHFDRFSSLRAFRSGDTFVSITCEAVNANTHCPWLALRIWPESEPAASTAP
jgi:hypothetical protein